ncbi:hypothetical protein DFH08DRAFT_894655 [Mycena albidolilacea]|uniref:Secreted protein n=1 Tax=Mycena albidolilacea TaxID=1033008 RepID=A0AAD7EEZ3_9AGAR|nr:hypothetical protein DFH08DRAFT_894655 [Mycena albidolilacea]
MSNTRRGSGTSVPVHMHLHLLTLSICISVDPVVLQVARSDGVRVVVRVFVRMHDSGVIEDHCDSRWPADPDVCTVQFPCNGRWAVDFNPLRGVVGRRC